MEEKIRVLYVDDEPNNLQSFKANFRRDYKVFIAESGKEGLEILDKEKVEIILTDQRMPEMTGIEFLVKVREKYPDPMRLLITGYADINAVIDAINKGQVFYYLTKPWNEDEVRIAIKNAYEVYTLRKENRELLEKLERANEQLEFLLRQKLLS
ncbi:MAG: response regulator [Bacteroidota bacterium]|nr:response regulator [Bacteroidota bacterium]